MNKKYAFVFLCFFSVDFVCAQTDSVQTRGTIRVTKSNSEEIHIKAQIKFENFDFSKIKGDVVKDQVTAPSPDLSGYNAPFNFTRYFNNQFIGKTIDLGNNISDTVRIAVKILANGKAYLKDASSFIMVGGVPAYYDSKVKAYKLDNIHLYCLDFMKELKWAPANVTKTRVSKFKKQQVIIPYRTNISASGVITIIFSSAEVDE